MQVTRTLNKKIINGLESRIGDDRFLKSSEYVIPTRRAKLQGSLETTDHKQKRKDNISVMYANVCNHGETTIPPQGYNRSQYCTCWNKLSKR